MFLALKVTILKIERFFFLQETWVIQKLSAVYSEESAGTEQVTRPSGSGVTQECRPVSKTPIVNLDNKLLAAVWTKNPDWTPESEEDESAQLNAKC